MRGINKPNPKQVAQQSIVPSLSDQLGSVQVRITFVSDREREEARIPSYGYILP